MHTKNLRHLYSIIILFGLAFAIGVLSIAFSFKTSLDDEKTYLLDRVQSRAHFMEVIAEFDQEHNQDYPGGPREATLTQVLSAQQKLAVFGKTGEYVLAELRHDKIVFLFMDDHASIAILKSVPYHSKLAEPMRKALDGESGIITGLDYKGKKVLAAFKPIPTLNLGLVAKVDYAELLSLPMQAAWVSGAAGLLVIIIGSALFFKMSASNVEFYPTKISRTKTPDKKEFLLGGALTLGLFSIDLAIPLGVAAGVGYVVLVIFSYWCSNKIYILYAAIIGSVFIILGLIFSPESGLPWMVLFNRFLSLFVIWIVAGVMYHNKKSDLALAESAMMNRSILSGSFDPIITTDILGKVISWNKSAEVVFGYKAEEAVGQLVSDLIIPQQYREAHINGIQNYIETEKSHIIGQHIEVHGINRKGEEFPVELTLSAIQLEKDIIFSAVIRNISESRKAEQVSIRLGRILEGSSNEIYIFHADTLKFMQVNSGAQNNIGYCADELMTMTPLDIKPELSFEQFNQLIEPLKSKKKDNIIFETIHQRKNGTRYPVEIRLQLSYSETPAVFVAFVQDITARKKIELELRESESRFRAIVEHAVDGMIVFNDRGLIEIINSAAEKQFGYSFSEVYYQSISMLIPEPERSQLTGYLEKHLISGKENFAGIDREIIACRKDGSQFHLNISVSELYWHGHKVFLGITRDATDRIRMEKELADYANNLEGKVEARTEELNIALKVVDDARNRTDAILKSIREGMIVTDINNKIIMMNDLAETILGTPFKEAFGKHIGLSIKDEKLKDRIIATFDKEEAGYEFDFEIPREKSGEQNIYRATTSVILDNSKKKMGILTIIHDVTHDRKIDRMKSEFISTAAHELRTPLTSIRGFSELLLTKEDKLTVEEKKRFLTSINSQSVRLASIINDLLDISRIEAGKGFALNKSLCIAREIIEEIIYTFRDAYQEFQFVEEYPEDSFEWFADQDKIKQVLTNVYSNAVKYSPNGGEIKTKVTLNHDYVSISIKDHGLGMTPEQVNKYFQKFYRADASNANIEGTGLGSTIIKYLVEAHEGKVLVESKLGEGTTVKLTIPLGKNQTSKPS